MKKAFILWLVLAVSAFGSHTMAWKVPLEHLVPGGTLSPECLRLDKPPGDSAFFATGDELWDVIAAVDWTADEELGFDPFAPPRKKDLGASKAEWLVWNATAGKLVGRGTWAQLDFVEKQLELPDQPKLIRTTFEIHSDEPKTRSVALLSQSGANFSSEQQSVEVSGTANISHNHAVADVSLVASWWRKPGVTDGIEINATVPTGHPVSLAKWQDPEGEWEVWVSCEGVNTQGRLITQLREVETPRGIKRIDDGSNRPPTVHRRELANGLVTGSFRVPPHLLYLISSNHGAHLPDLVDDKDAKIFPGLRWVDVREPLRENGVRLSSPGSAAGFHPDHHILTVVGEPIDLDLVETIVSPGICCPNLVVEHTLEGPEVHASLLCRSGERIRIVRSRSGTSRKLLEIATNIGAGDRLMDVSYFLDLEGGIRLSSASILTTGEPQEIGVFESDGKRSSVTLTGTIRVMDH